MPDKFLPNRRYKFSRDIFLTDTGLAWQYENNRRLRDRVNSADGMEVEVINEQLGLVGNYNVAPRHCTELLSSTHQAVKQVCNELYREVKGMKFSEAIAGLENNPNDKYEATSKSGKHHILSSEGSYFKLDIYLKKGGKLIETNMLGGGFNENIRIDMEWRQVQEPVDFMTAVNSGKKIRPLMNKGYAFDDAKAWFELLSGNGNMGKNWEKYINNQWVIEP